jgi:hypothetical protein
MAPFSDFQGLIYSTGTLIVKSLKEVIFQHKSIEWYFSHAKKICPVCPLKQNS